MHEGSIGKPTNNHTPSCAAQVTMAERELSAFFRAVTELFGSEQPQLSAKDWLHELSESANLPGPAREWSLITAKVSSRIAGRVRASSLLTETQSL